MNSKIFSDLMSFIKGAHQGNSVERTKTIVIHEIPTAALITGDLFMIDMHILLLFMMPTLLNIFHNLFA